MRRGYVIALVAVLMAAAATAWSAPQSVDLQLKGQAGSEWAYDNLVTMEMDLRLQNPMDASRVITVSPLLRASAATKERVEKVADNGDLSIRSQVESFDVNLDLANLHLAFAIGGPGPDQLIKLPPLPFQVVMSKRGKVMAVEGLDALIPPIPGPTGEKIQLGKFLTAMIGRMSQPLYPEGPVTLGQSWEWKMVFDPAEIMGAMGLPLPPEAKQQMESMKIPIRSTSTLVGFEEVGGIECAKIEAVAPWQLDMPIPNPKGESVTVRESGNTKVTTWFDYQAGHKARETTEVTVDMTVTTGAVTPMKMSMRIQGETALQGLSGARAVRPRPR